MRKLILVLPIVLAGCSTTLVEKFNEYRDKGEDYAAKGLVEVAAYRCENMSLEQRKNLVDAFNAEAQAKGATFRASALDCNGDGEPDFR